MPAKKKLHTKPTTEELQESIEEAPKETEEVKVEKEVSEDVDEKVSEEEEVDEKKVEEKDEKPVEKKPDYRKRYEDSSREAHILYSKNRKMTEAIEKASQVAEPTEEELKAEFPEWDTMSDFEQRMAKDNLVNKKKLDGITAVSKDFRDMDAWNKKVDEFLIDPEVLIKNPGLDGKEEEFKTFVSKETRRGVDFETLVSAFLYSESQTPTKKNKGSMFETGTAGDSEKPKPKGDKITTEEAIRLRQTNYNEYRRLLQEGKIDDSEITS
jgi:hypothetical protein